jgi:hypothetical protein
MTPGTTAQLDGSLFMEFVCRVTELVDRIKAGAILDADIINVTEENYDELLGKAQVPLSPLLSETWVQGLAKIWAPGIVPISIAQTIDHAGYCPRLHHAKCALHLLARFGLSQQTLSQKIILVFIGCLPYQLPSNKQKPADRGHCSQYFIFSSEGPYFDRFWQTQLCLHIPKDTGT